MGSFLLGAGTAPTASTGALAHALQNAQNTKVAKAQRISTTQAQQAIINNDIVVWYTASGTQEVTEVGSAQTAFSLFGKYGYYDYKVASQTGAAQTISELLTPLLLLAAFGFVWFTIRKGGFPGMQVGKSRARLIEGEGAPQVTFSDVAGADEAVVELSEVVSILRNPERFAAMGARTPRGVLLCGPPGTGKTLLARAVAGESGVPFFSLSGSEFVEMFVGVGASRVRDLFAEARKRGAAIIFIDEIDAVGRNRGAGTGHSNDEREQTLNQLLVEMDGFDNTAPIIVIAATNRPDVLDSALLRPGRFDRRVMVDIPDIAGREAILRLHAMGKPIDPNLDLAVVARQTPGATGADLANVLNEAALLAARRDSMLIGTKDLEEAVMRIQAGPERAHSFMSDAEKTTVAYHEIGHALVSHVLPNSDPVHRISIVSRGRALGWTMTLPERDRALTSRAQLTDQLAGMMGGRCAEELIFGEDAITTGAADDIERATHLATKMVRDLGMSSLGLRTFPDGDPLTPRPYSEVMARDIDDEVDMLLTEAADRARAVLRDRKVILDALAHRLVEVETMEASEMAQIVSSFPGQPAPPVSVVPHRVHLPLVGPAASGGDDHNSRPPMVGMGSAQGQTASHHTRIAIPVRWGKTRALLRAVAWRGFPGIVSH